MTRGVFQLPTPLPCPCCGVRLTAVRGGSVPVCWGMCIVCAHCFAFLCVVGEPGEFYLQRLNAAQLARTVDAQLWSPAPDGFIRMRGEIFEDRMNEQAALCMRSRADWRVPLARRLGIRSAAVQA